VSSPGKPADETFFNDETVKMNVMNMTILLGGLPKKDGTAEPLIDALNQLNEAVFPANKLSNFIDKFPDDYDQLIALNNE